MNILFVAPMPMIPYIGGIQRVTCILAEELMRQGHHITFLCCNDAESNQTGNIVAEQVYIPIDTSAPDTAIKAYHYLLNKLHVECVIFQWVNPLVAVWFCHTPRTIKVVAASHGQPYANHEYMKEVARSGIAHNFRQVLWYGLGSICPAIHRRYWQRHENKYYRLLASSYADKVCLLSKSFIPRLLHFLPDLDANKITAISNPLTSSQPKDIDWAHKENIVLFVGRISNGQKNVLGFVDVWKKVAKHNSGWKAIVVGDGQDLPAMKRYAHKHNVANIEFAGNQKDVASFYSKSKIILITSFWEGFSMVLVEAMSYGCVPCAFDTYEALHDIVDHEKNGFICPAFDKADMAARVQTLVDNPETCERMGRDAMEKVNVFDVRRIASQWLALIDSIEKP